MTCADVRSWIDAYADRELDLPTSVEVEKHLQTCEACRQVLAGREALRTAIRGELRYSAPDSLRERVATSLRTEAGKQDAEKQTERQESVTTVARRGVWFELAWGAVAILLLAAVVSVFWMRAGQQREIFAEAMVTAHVRSLQPSHLTDVLSSDQHTVKPWFTGKIDFSPVVVDLTAQGFPLVGGRLDYIEGHNAAALVYQRRKHTINVFVWPGETRVMGKQFVHDGYNILFWREGGLNYCAVSDVNAADLKELAEKLR